MPKHIVSGLKYLAAEKLITQGYSQKDVAKQLGMDRSTVSHYLNGRNLSWHSIDVANTIMELCPKDFLLIVDVLFQDTEKLRKFVSICQEKQFVAKIEDSCIGCGLCVDLCKMKAIKLDSLKAKVSPDYCCGCLICEEQCPTKSINILEVNK